VKRGFRISMAVIAVFVLLTCVGGEPLIESAFHLAVGWIRHLVRVLPGVTIAWSGIALFAIALLAALCLAHGTTRWLWNDPSRPWRWKWTLLGGVAVILMFVSGIAATGVVHQVGWMVRSPVPLVLFGSRREISSRTPCADNLQRIGAALSRYANTHGGYRPRDRDDLVRTVAAEGLQAADLICPASFRDPAPGTRPAEWVPNVDESHFAYVVPRTPILAPDGQRRVIVYEPIENHYNMGLNVLFEDGEVEWINRKLAADWLKSVETSQPSSR
jgi:hypothetical protein